MSHVGICKSQASVPGTARSDDLQRLLRRLDFVLYYIRLFNGRWPVGKAPGIAVLLAQSN